MEFGKTDNPGAIDFFLPPDHPDTADLFATLPPGTGKRGTTRVFAGCAKWGRDDWVGSLYPRGTRAAQYLTLYARALGCVELNVTFHQMPDALRMRKWAAQSPKGFRFCPKIYQGISHRQRLRGAEAVTERFLQGIDGLGERLGPLFLQLPPNFSPREFEALCRYLEFFPTDSYRLFVELRHPDWFGTPGVYDETFSMFRELNTGCVITDTPGRRDLLHMRLTKPEAFVRFAGSNQHPSDSGRLADWTERIRMWADNGAGEVYFFVHHPDEVHSPETISAFIDQLHACCGDSVLLPPRLQTADDSFGQKEMF